MDSEGLAPIAIILIIIGVLAIGGGVWYLGTQTSTQPVAAPQPTLSPTPSVSPTPFHVDETANWKTYRNDTYGFELKYPESIPFQDELHDSLTNSLSVRSENNTYILFFYVNLPKGFEDAESYGNKNLILKDREIKVILLQDQYSTGSVRGIDLIAPIYDDKTGDIYTVRLYCKLLACNQEEMRILIDQILSTFKFISQ